MAYLRTTTALNMSPAFADSREIQL